MHTKSIVRMSRHCYPLRETVADDIAMPKKKMITKWLKDGLLILLFIFLQCWVTVWEGPGKRIIFLVSTGIRTSRQSTLFSEKKPAIGITSLSIGTLFPVRGIELYSGLTLRFRASSYRSR